jgi:16S rRNA (adenine1518-N6/adenine1519-N6)-dimethyltransferase
MAVELLGARRLRELLRAHGANPKRSLGQNFVIDPNTIRKVVAAARIGPNDRVLELGAGCGSLTLGLAGEAAHVTAIEIDDRLVALLNESLAGIGNVSILHEDAIASDLGAIDATVAVGNLPYNIATHLVLRVLEEAPGIRRLTVMTQKEVGDRLAAPAGSKVYGQTSVMVRYFGTAEVVGRVSRRAFYPVPNVDSVIVAIERGPQPDVDRALLFGVVRAAFSQRRKTVRNALATLAGSPGAAEEALERAGLAPSARAEQLTLDDFVALARALPGGPR